MKWLPPIEPPHDRLELADVWRMYEEGRIIVTQVHNGDGVLRIAPGSEE